MPSTAAGAIERDELRAEHFAGWIDWAQAHGIGARFQSDFLFASEGGRAASRWPAAMMGFGVLGRARHRVPARSARRLGRRWDRRASRTSGFPTATRTCRSIARRRASGCGARSTRSLPSRSIRGYNLDAVESKLFGIGSESYVVGSHEFYLGYAIRESQAAVPRLGALPSDRERSPTRFPRC